MIDPKIRTFLMIVELRNYTQAGKVLAMSQPAVSHQMRQLEEEYNIKICLLYTSFPHRGGCDGRG